MKGDWPLAAKGPDGHLYFVVELREDQVDLIVRAVLKALDDRKLTQARADSLARIGQ